MIDEEKQDSDANDDYEPVIVGDGGVAISAEARKQLMKSGTLSQRAG